MTRNSRASRLRVLAVLCLLASVASLARAERPRVYAITGADLVPRPGEHVAGGTIVIRDGLIESLGANVEAPPDAVEIDGAGSWVYPGLIDANTTLGLESASAQRPAGAAGGGAGPGRGAARRQTAPGAAHPLSRVHPERRAVDRLRPFEGDRQRAAERYRNLGFTTVLAVPDSGLFRGSSVAILLLDDAPVAELVLRDEVATHVALERGRFGQGYPTSLMGAAAAVRQTLLDSRRHAEWSARYAAGPRGMARPEHVAAFAALGPVLSGARPAFFHAESPADVLLADRLAREFGLRATIAASGHEWEIADRLREAGRPLILPVAFPDKPKVDDDDEALDVPLETLRRFLDAPAAAARLHEAGVRFAFTTSGLKNLADFPKNLRKIVEAGLPEETALAALTTVPAELLGLEPVLGTLAPGKIANLVLFDGPLFAEDTKPKRVFVDGTEYKLKEKKKPQGDPNAVVDPRGEWSVVFEFGPRTVERTWTIEGERGNYTGTAETQSGTVAFDSVELEGNMLTVVYPARGERGAMELTVIIKGKGLGDSFEGSAEMGPRTVPVRGTRTSGPGGGAR